MHTDNSIKAATRASAQRLQSWLINSAYPLWSAKGCDLQHGGFHERLDANGNGIDEPRRARVQPRQIYSFAMAKSLGWSHDMSDILRRGFEFYFKSYRRADGLNRSLVKPNGEIVDDRVVLYDQAFGLLACATARDLESELHLEAQALQLRAAIYREFKRTERGFKTASPDTHPLNATLQSNPHMHMFEACLGWMQVSKDPEWQRLADEIGQLALDRFIDFSTGALREFFDNTWHPVKGIEGRIVEPGHQFEWAWLLLRWDASNRFDARRAALRLIDIGEHHGVRNGVAVNSLLDDFSIHDGAARLWPQTERIKAAAIAARITGEERYWKMTSSAIDGLLLYLNTPVTGLWLDRRTADGKMIEEPSPASSFYHIVAAVAELQALTA